MLRHVVRHSCNIHPGGIKQLMDKTPMDSEEDLVARYFFNKISTTLGGFKSFHFIPTWYGLWIQVIDATFS
ncbi:hypothetical protein AVEN_224799-1, partial [Araneus ventricosus]